MLIFTDPPQVYGLYTCENVNIDGQPLIIEEIIILWNIYMI